MTWEVEESTDSEGSPAAEDIAALDSTAVEVRNASDDAAKDRVDELEDEMDISAVHDDIVRDRYQPGRLGAQMGRASA